MTFDGHNILSVENNGGFTCTTYDSALPESTRRFDPARFSDRDNPGEAVREFDLAELFLDHPPRADSGLNPGQ